MPIRPQNFNPITTLSFPSLPSRFSFSFFFPYRRATQTSKRSFSMDPTYIKPRHHHHNRNKLNNFSFSFSQPSHIPTRSLPHSRESSSPSTNPPMTQPPQKTSTRRCRHRRRDGPGTDTDTARQRIRRPDHSDREWGARRRTRDRDGGR